MGKKRVEASFIALIPFLLFIVIYLGVGVYLNSQGVAMAFYQFPAPTAVLIGVIVAFLMHKGSIEEKFDTFLTGCRDENIIIMCIIYLLAGAFSGVAKASGGVDSFVNLGLTLIPAQFMTAGLFIISCFMSTATGTSMGTIAAVGPIAFGVAQAAGLGLPLTMAAVIGGAMFGDNLSIISDTTIAATRTQGVEMRDKFRMNFTIALPAAVITVILLLITGTPKVAAAIQIGDYNVLKVIPYAVVLVAALMGVNVFAVLAVGVILSGIIGIAAGSLSFLTFGQEVFNGMVGMFDVFLTSLFIGGLAEMTKKAGGLQFLINGVEKIIKGPKSAEIGIAALVSVTDLAVANNTVAIIIDGPIAKEICYEYKVDPRRSASFLDIFSCVMQGVIPYGAQMLLVGTLTGGAVFSLEIIPLLWYQMLLAVFAIVSIYIPFADGVIRKNPWNWEKGMAQDKVDRLAKESEAV